jgi:hypothetical protein
MRRRSRLQTIALHRARGETRGGTLSTESHSGAHLAGKRKKVKYLGGVHLV